MYNENPACLFDVETSKDVGDVTHAFKRSVSLEISAILVNISNGAERCDTIAQSITEAANTLDIKLPIVVFLKGENFEGAKTLIASSPVPIFLYDKLDEAAAMVVKLADFVDRSRI